MTSFSASHRETTSRPVFTADERAPVEMHATAIYVTADCPECGEPAALELPGNAARPHQHTCEHCGATGPLRF